MVDAGLTELIAPDQRDVLGLRITPAPGHTPGMLNYWLESRGEIGVFSADVFHHPAQIYYPDWNTAFCVLQDESKKTRHAFVAEAARTGALIMPCHFPQPHTGYVRRQGDGYAYEPAKSGYGTIRRLTHRLPGGLPMKTIITCAATGASLSKAMSPNLPVTPKEIADQSVEAAKAGAAIIHLHARENDGKPTNATPIWREFIADIRKRCDAIINMSASLGPTAEERLSAVLALRPEIATVIVGSMNYGLFRKVKDQGSPEFKHDWEKEHYGPKSYRHRHEQHVREDRQDDRDADQGRHRHRVRVLRRRPPLYSRASPQQA